MFDNRDICIFCKMPSPIRGHHIIPRSKGGTEIVLTCETCESYIHKTWTHNQLRDTYNSVEAILADGGFRKFLKWRRKQPATSLFKSRPGKYRDKRKYT
jgi:5-methylcytosine-specific restriction enzyme A